MSSSEETVVLPDRFDEEGRLIERSRSGGGRGRGRERGGSRSDGARGGGQTEMVERLVADFGDVIEGRKSWKDMLRDVVVSAQGAGLGGLAGGGGSDEERRGSGRRR